MSSTHRAVVATSAGVIGVDDVDTPEVGPGEVAVRVGVSGVNPVDAHVIAGAFGPDVFPYIAGCEFTGEIVSVGSEIGSRSPGDRVAAQPKPFMGDPGAWQDIVVLPVDRVAAVPDDLTDEVAGTVVLPALTALTLARAGALGAGQAAVVPGAAGGVGRWLTQLLLADGVAVTTVTSGDDVEEMAAWGAVAVDRDDATAVAGLKDFDALFDVAGGGEEAVAQRWGWLADDGRYLSVSSQGDDIEFMMVQWDADGLEHLLQGVADGTFKVPTAKLYPPKQVQAAIDDFTSRRVARTALDFRQV